MLLKFIALLALACAFADDGITIINLRYRSADTLIPILRGLYGNQVAISGSNLKLIVRAPQAIVTEIRQLTNDLDRKPRMLRVAIRDAGQGSTQDSQLGVNGSVKLAAGLGAAGRVIGNDSSSQTKSSGDRYIMVEEGVPASLGDGSGTQVVAKVEGERVSLQLVPAAAGINGAPTANGSSLNTTANAQPGQWVQVGGTTQTAQGSNSGILNSASHADQSSSQLMLKVDPQ